jgi:hypothetical protein
MNIEEFQKLSREAMVEVLRDKSPELVRGKTRAKKTELVEIYSACLSTGSKEAVAETVAAMGAAVVELKEELPHVVEIVDAGEPEPDPEIEDYDEFDPSSSPSEIERKLRAVPTELIHKAAQWHRLPYSNRKSKRVKRASGIKLDKALRKFGVNLQMVCEEL